MVERIVFFVVDTAPLYCTITYMSHTVLESAESVFIHPEFQKQLDAHSLTKQDIEEILLNFPIVKKVNMSFSDAHDRFCAEGTTDIGKKIKVIFYIHAHKMYPTYIFTL